MCLVVIPHYNADNAKSEYTLAYTLNYLPYVIYNEPNMAALMFKYYPCDNDNMTLAQEILMQSSLPKYHTRLYVSVLRHSLNIDARVATNGCRLTPVINAMEHELMHLGRETNAPLSSKYQDVSADDARVCG